MMTTTIASRERARLAPFRLRASVRSTAHVGAGVRRWRLSLLCVVLLGVGGCAAFSPQLVEESHYLALEAPITRLAVLPFYPNARLSRRAGETGGTAWEAAALVTRFVTEAVSGRGAVVIPESDVQLAFAGGGQVTPRSDPVAAARLVAEQFGATAVLLGDVDRYRERSGSAYGSKGSASVHFEVTLYLAPEGRKIWSARFDQTQPSMTENPITAMQYPGGGMRFLTVAELARFGADLVAAGMPVGEGAARRSQR